MEKNFAGINRIIRILDEELTELQTAGLYREAEKARKRLEVYLDMRDRAYLIAEGLPDDEERQR
jgi:hypothetical protein|tara:strand:+ start:347 stop:538 length:192 start_codon:yes stop_codon:yes gene_type:complete